MCQVCLFNGQESQDTKFISKMVCLFSPIILAGIGGIIKLRNCEEGESQTQRNPEAEKAKNSRDFGCTEFCN